jgi:hypothetical protein
MQMPKCSRYARVFRTLIVGSVVVFHGCRETPTSVSGAVTLDGKPLTVASDARGTVLFQAIGGQGTVATGILDPTGHFQLAAGSSSEIPPGKYQVAVTVSQLLPKSDNAEQRAKLITPATYASVQDSGLQAEVKPGENHFDFGLNSAGKDIEPKLKAND